MPSSAIGKAAWKERSFQWCLNPQRCISDSADDTRSNSNPITCDSNFGTSLHRHTQFTNHESLPLSAESFRSFLRAFPQYLQTVEADHIRAHDYFHLSVSNHICLDYVGYGLFSYAQERGHVPTADVASSSSAPPPQPIELSRIPSFELSYRSAQLNFQTTETEQESDFESQVRERIMRFLNISSDDYSLVFTANESSAFKVLAESYPFQTNRNLLTVYDHDRDAIEAMVESSKRRGAIHISAEFEWPQLEIHSKKLKESIVWKKKRKRRRKRGLFVFPLNSRVTGASYSYQWMNMAKENDWHVLLDATALGPKTMDTLGLSLFQPDFLTCTCYKVFGQNPSGFGCLFIKRSSSPVLMSSTTIPGSGIVKLIPPVTRSDNNQTAQTGKHKDDQAASTSLSGEMHQTASLDLCSHASLTIEEFHQTGGGISNANSSPQVIQFKGLDDADALGLALIGRRLRYLINWLINAMSSLRHPDSESGRPLINIYGPAERFDRAPALAFNLFDWKGERVDPVLVQQIAGRNNISLGGGFVKHIRFGERYREDRERVLERRTIEEKADKGRKKNNDPGISVVTVTIAYLNNFEDVYGLWTFVSRFLDADFVGKERWRYAALNQRIVEV